jgi:hypothetical protein
MPENPFVLHHLYPSRKTESSAEEINKKKIAVAQGNNPVRGSHPSR